MKMGEIFIQHKINTIRIISNKMLYTMKKFIDCSD